MYKDTLTVKGLGIGEGYPVRIMGVINLSPESFYSDSIVTDNENLLNKTKQMIAEGADILDIGGASTAPKKYYDTKNTTQDVEIQRVANSLEIIAEIQDVPISIDTPSAAVAETALDLGASIVNDVTGLQGDSKMAKLVADRGVPLIMMAHCTNACLSVKDSIRALKKSWKIAKEAGISKESVIVDPGIGFGKPAEVDCDILKELESFKSFKRPVLVGISRKAFIGEILNEKDPKNRLVGSLAATAIAVVNGADVIRTHDVKETRLAVKVGEALW